MEKIEKLNEIKKKQEVVKMYVTEVDEMLNLIGYIGDNIYAMMPRNEVSCVLNDEGVVDEKAINSKINKKIDVCIKEIIKKEDGTLEVIVSKKILEIKVRRWMFYHLKEGMKLRGYVKGYSDYAAFIDVGGGVTGILKKNDLTTVPVNEVKDIVKIGQRLNVIVKNYDRDTGRIDLSCIENLGTFEERVKNLKEGDTVQGIVRTRMKTGIFIELPNNVLGISEHFNGIEYGQKVLVYIKRINIEKEKVKVVIIG